MADARSGGGAAAKEPASCIAPYPDRLTCICPSVNVDMRSKVGDGKAIGCHPVQVICARLGDRRVVSFGQAARHGESPRDAEQQNECDAEDKWRRP
jgi:hypothetical protein